MSLLPFPPARVAVVAITRHGIAAAARVLDALPGAQLFAPEKFAALAPQGATLFAGSTANQVERLFAFEAVVWVVSIGAVVRLVAPHLKDKACDPGMVVLDEAMRFAVPILSGHLGGANALADHLARALGATPVLTTASDARATLTVDILGRALGWTVEAPKENVTRACAAVVNDEPVAFVREVGSDAWWTGPESIPGNIVRYERLEDVAAEDYAAVLWVSRRELPPDRAASLAHKLVTYRPPDVALGIGCDRGTPVDTLMRAVDEALALAGSDAGQVSAVGSIDLKADEPGLQALARRLGWQIAYYPAAQLAAVAVANPSETVRRHTGTPSVAEAAALLAADAEIDHLLIEKHRACGADGRHATVAVARISP